MIVYVSIGNSDDKLTQADWVQFIKAIDGYLLGPLKASVEIHGRWFSAPDSRWQNACWCIDFIEDLEPLLKGYLSGCCSRYGQDSIAWAEVPVTEFLTADSRPD